MKKKEKKIVNKFKEREAWAIIIFIFSIITLLGIVGYDFSASPHPDSINTREESGHLLGKFGVLISYFLVTKTIGIFSIIFPIILLIIAYAMFFKKDFLEYSKKSIFLFLLAIVLSIFFDKILSLYFSNFSNLSGVISMQISNAIYGIFGKIGFWLFIPSSIIILISFLFEFSLYEIVIKISKTIQFFLKKFIIFISLFLQKIKSISLFAFKKMKPKKNTKIEISKSNDIDAGSDTPQTFSNNGLTKTSKDVDDKKIENKEINNEEVIITEITDSTLPENNKEDNQEEIEIEDEIQIEQGNLDEHESRKSIYKNYKLPLTEHLITPIEIDKDDDAMLTDKARQLQHALETFGVKSEVKKITQGPVITMFEIEPNEGVRVNKFTNLSDDLARVMAAQRIRVIAPIPGTKAIGIELPNENPSIVYLKTIINSEQYINSDSKLTIGLGKTTTGDAYIFDLGKMPHLLVAGATGAGKSVCINTIIVSILYKAKPDEVKFIMVDPKKLELATYKSLVGYHLITAPNLDEYVMTTAENAVGILNSAITEMERRFQVFSDARVRNIAEYHDRCKKNDELENIPYIVVLIDELADLMMTSGRAVEEPITRLAQKARAVGIHLVVATQRPSVDVITGLIKSNFPARISFQVSSKVDSRTILDQMGAEKLLGRGDMLFLLPGSASPIRLHNAFIELDEIEKIMNHITNQPKPNEIHLPEIAKISTEGNFSVDNDSSDDLLYEAAKIVVDSQQASVSLLQRKLRVGYSRAGRLVDELESLGIITEHNGSKPRDVLVDNRYIDNIFNK